VAARPAELVGIDLGTSSVKVGVFAGDGQLLSFARRSYQQAGALAEPDPQVWWQATASALREAGSDLDLRSSKAICVGGQGPTLVLVDDQIRPVRNALSWQDTRASQQAERIKGAAFSLVPKLLWVAENEPEALHRARWALQAWDFIAARLAGSSAAASTFKGDVVWRPEHLVAAGLAELPQIPTQVDAGVAYATTDGEWAEAAGVPPGIAIVGGMNDGVGSIVGAAGSVVGRATDPGGAAGGLALCWHTTLHGPGVDSWAGLVPGTVILGGAFAASGRAVDWWSDLASDGDLNRTLAQAAESEPGGHGLVFLPFLSGERSPLWDPHARGAFIGLSLEHRQTHLARAVVESTAYQLRLLAEAILALGTRIDELRVCGGPAGSELWNQIKADVLGSPVSVPRLPEVALMGDAICAAIGAGFYADLASAGEAMVQIGQVLEPQPTNQAVYDELFSVYRDAYQALKPLLPRLAALQLRSSLPI
jgi:xylulokinase